MATETTDEFQNARVERGAGSPPSRAVGSVGEHFGWAQDDNHLPHLDDAATADPDLAAKDRGVGEAADEMRAVLHRLAGENVALEAAPAGRAEEHDLLRQVPLPPPPRA